MERAAASTWKKLVYFTIFDALVDRERLILLRGISSFACIERLRSRYDDVMESDFLIEKGSSKELDCIVSFRSGISLVDASGSFCSRISLVDASGS